MVLAHRILAFDGRNKDKRKKKSIQPQFTSSEKVQNFVFAN
jgi:hypothetical protein